MSTKQFSGITTVEDLRERCVVDDLTGCWHWRGAAGTDRRGRPTQRLWVYDSVRGRFRTMSGPMAVVELKGERTTETEQGWRTCTTADCMCPQHIMGGTRKQWGEWTRASGRLKGLASKTAANRANVRGRSKHAHAATIIKSSDLPTGELAKLLNLPPTYVSDIKGGRRWADGKVLPGASVFTWGATP
jgi:hypothetical protein